MKMAGAAPRFTGNSATGTDAPAGARRSHSAAEGQA